MATLTINSPSVSYPYGTVSITILLEASSDATTTMNLLSMPVIAQEFDVQDTAKDLSTFRYNLSTIKLSVFDDLGDGTKLFTAINNLGTNDVIRIKITNNIFDSTNRTDFFVSTRGDCSFDRVKRTITMEGRAALRYDVEVTSFSTSGLVTTDTAASTAGLITSKDAILAFLKSQGDSSVSTKIIGHRFTDTISELGQGNTPFKTLGLDAATHYDTYAKAQTHVLKFGIIEGAFIGSMLGFSFYVRRNFQDTSTSDNFKNISASDLRDFGITFDLRNVKNFNTTFAIQDNGISGQPQISASVTEAINSRGSQDIVLSVAVADMNTLFNDISDSSKTKLLSSGAEGDSAINADTFTNGTTGISVNARTSYKKALGIGANNLDNDNRFLITFEILGLNTLRPYQFINFQNDIHPSVNGKKARASLLEYDFENNIIKGEAYLIS
tara:strand:+ start:2065 stop:3387 length:1323 start_codon:yes stop_codon:yes gene_type:complete